MQALCRIVDTERYSQEEAFQTMKILYKWTKSYDGTFSERFFDMGGPIKVLTYLEKNMDRSERLTVVAGVIARITYPGPNKENENICKEITKVLVKRDVIRLLLSADEEYVGGSNMSELIALRNVWNALMNVTAYTDDASKKDQLLFVVDTGLDTFEKLSTVTSPITSNIKRLILKSMENNLQ